MPWQNEAPSAATRLLPAGLDFSDTPSRVVAYFLDSIVIGVVNSIPLTLTGAFNVGYLTFPDRTAFVFAELIGFVLVFAYFVWFWSGGRRATPGQRVFGIQVANAFDGQPLSTKQAIKRWLGTGLWTGIAVLLPFLAVGVATIVIGGVWWLVVLISTIASPTKQGIHDRLAGSAVVRPAGASNRWAVITLVVLAILIVAEGLILFWTFTSMPAEYLPVDYWDRYIHWLWPS